MRGSVMKTLRDRVRVYIGKAAVVLPCEAAAKRIGDVPGLAFFSLILNLHRKQIVVSPEFELLCYSVMCPELHQSRHNVFVSLLINIISFVNTSKLLSAMKKAGNTVRIRHSTKAGFDSPSAEPPPAKELMRSVKDDVKRKIREEHKLRLPTGRPGALKSYNTVASARGIPPDIIMNMVRPDQEAEPHPDEGQHPRRLREEKAAGADAGYGHRAGFRRALHAHHRPQQRPR